MLESENEKKKPSLEDLLRVKKAEKPSDDFWKRFDRDLEKKIVQSVVHRESWAESFFRWVYSRGKVITAVSCVTVGAFFLLSSEDAAPVVETSVHSQSLPAPAASEALQKVDTWASRNAPSIDASNQDFVIEVLSSGAGPSAGAGRTWMGASVEDESSAYYVADQLSSSEVGWSGERLPF